MPREMALAGVTAEELQKAPQAQPPRTPRQKWENFWYHYKWITIAALAAVVIVAMLVGDFLRKNPADYTLVVATEQAYFSAELEPLRSMVAQYGRDLDGDGEVEVQIVTCHLGSGGTRENQLANFQSLQMHLASGDMLLFAFEPEYYTWVKETMESKGHDFFTPLELVAPGIGEDGRYWNWADDPRVAEATVALPKDLFFAVRRAIGTAAEREEEHGQCMALLTAFVTDTAPQTE